MSEQQHQLRRDGARPRLAAIILAAGYSSRMGAFKPLLRIGADTITEILIKSFHSAGIGDVRVVLGHRAGELAPVVEAAGAHSVKNPDFQSGMYSSVCAGVRALSAKTDGCFIIPVDIPLVRRSTIHRLAEHYAAFRSAITYPVRAGRRGHPPLVSYDLLTRAIEEDRHRTLAELLSAHRDAACNLEVPDEGIHQDMDTPDAFRKLCALAAHRSNGAMP